MDPTPEISETVSDEPPRCFWYFGTGLGKTWRATEEAGEGAVFIPRGDLTIRCTSDKCLVFDDCEPGDSRITRNLLPILSQTKPPKIWITSIEPPPEEFKKIPGVRVVEFKE